MGLLDDLQMGFGLKERTEDYDARTARTIAANEAAQRRGRGGDAMALAQARNPSHFSYIGDDAGSSGGARTFLDRIGGESYNPRPAVDNRTMFQRLLFSPESTPSPTPYAIGPVKFDEPLRIPTMFGLLGGLLGGFGRGGDEMAPPQTTIRPMLRPEAFTPYVSSGQPETTFTEDFSGVEKAEFEEPMPVDALTELTESAISAAPDAAEPTRDEMLDALYEVTGDYNAALNDTDGIRKLYQKYVVDRVPFPYDRKRVPPLLADPTGEQLFSTQNKRVGFSTAPSERPALNFPNDALLDPAFGPNDTGYYDSQMMMGVGTDQIFTPLNAAGLTLITRGPHAGKYIDSRGRLVMP
jgi:hypothetical protein